MKLRLNLLKTELILIIASVIFPFSVHAAQGFTVSLQGRTDNDEVYIFSPFNYTVAGVELNF